MNAATLEAMMRSYHSRYEIPFIRLLAQPKDNDRGPGILTIYFVYHYAPAGKKRVLRAFGISLPPSVQTWTVPKNPAHTLKTPEGDIFAEIIPVNPQFLPINVFLLFPVGRGVYQEQEKITRIVFDQIFEALERLGLIARRSSLRETLVILGRETNDDEGRVRSRLEETGAELHLQFDWLREKNERLQGLIKTHEKLKAEAAELIERRGKEFDELLENPAVETVGVDGQWLSVRTKPLVVTVNDPKKSGHLLRYDVGRWIARVHLETGAVRVFPADGQSRSGTMLHPHVYNRSLPHLGVEANELCWGNLKPVAARCAEERKYGLLFDLVFTLLGSCHMGEDPTPFDALRDIGRLLP
ncbi:hypothetical protein HY628_01015 [Candidatus Uhrbacteria bacterium]|nr:hypothetical protein [Candidatus Uhrbacteria bacterium]